MVNTIAQYVTNKKMKRVSYHLGSFQTDRMGNVSWFVAQRQPQ